MIVVNQNDTEIKNSQFEGNNLSLYCKRCKKFIRVSQIVRKKIENSASSMASNGTLKNGLKKGAASDAPSVASQYFTIFIYYCKKCDSYYFKFKTITIQTAKQGDLQGLKIK